MRLGVPGGGQVWAARGSWSSTLLPGWGRCQEEPVSRQSWADSAGRHARRAPSLCVPSKRG